MRAGGRAHLHMQSVQERGVLVSGAYGQSSKSRGPGNGGETQYFLVAGEANSVCPSHLPAEVDLHIESRCCDVIPAKLGCISPFPWASFAPIATGT